MTIHDSASPSLDAVLLAGGTGRRLGGIDKAGLVLGGERLVDRVAEAARQAGASRIIVVGPEGSAAPGCLLTREDPPGSGPLAAVAAGLAMVEASHLLLLPCDLRHPGPVCAALAQALPVLAGCEGVVLSDENGRTQWLAGIYSTSVLRAAATGIGDLRDRPLRILFESLHLHRVPLAGGFTADIDTPDDLRRAREELVD